MSSIVLRIFSKAGRSRVEIKTNSTLLDLKTELASRLGLEARKIQLFTDQGLKKAVGGSSSTTLEKLGLKNGDILHVGNQDAELASVKEARAAAAAQQAAQKQSDSDNTKMIDTSGSGSTAAANKNQAKPTVNVTTGKTSRCNHISSQKCVHCMSSATQQKDGEEKKAGEKGAAADTSNKLRCNHPSSQKCPNCIEKTTEEVAGTKRKPCRHGPNQKCPNCVFTEEGLVQDRKHESFDSYLKEMRKKCAKLHSESQKCQNCTFSQDQRYTVDYECKNHAPYPAGSCQRCIPQTVILKRQFFRHVDYVSFMNFKELSKFVGHWQKSGCMEQRIGYLYGYYSEDPNYPEGVRVNVEAIYEPPQISEINGALELDDPTMHKVDMIASALNLERVGFIFTKMDQETVLTASELKRAAKQQQEHIFDHPMGFKVPKFVTVCVQLKGEDVEVNCYMVSDQCQAIVDAGVFTDNEDRKKLYVREPGPTEMVPAFMQEGKPVKQVEPDFFVVSLAHGQPAHQNDFNVLKLYDFPVRNRDEAATPAHFTGYLRKYAGDPSEKSFANFQLLLFLAEMMDIDTALTCANCVGQEQPLDPALIDLFKAM